LEAHNAHKILEAHKCSQDGTEEDVINLRRHRWALTNKRKYTTWTGQLYLIIHNSRWVWYTVYGGGILNFQGPQASIPRNQFLLPAAYLCDHEEVTPQCPLNVFYIRDLRGHCSIYSMSANKYFL
jgi:hypothetical protein